MSNYHSHKARDRAISHPSNRASLRHLVVIFLTLAIAACASTPEPKLQVLPEPQILPEPQTLPEPVVEQEVIPAKPTIDYDRRNYQTALKALKSDDTDLAIELLERVSSKAPDIEYVFTNLGLAYFKNKNYDKAEQSLLKAIKLNSNDAIAFNHLGIIKRIQGQFGSAKQTYQQAIAIDSDYARAYLNLGILYDMYLQDIELALGQYQKYQALTHNENKTVTQWIVDIERRIKSAQSKKQG